MLGCGTTFGLRGLVPLGGAGGFSHTVLFGIDRESFERTIRLGSSGNEYAITCYPVSATRQGSFSGETRTAQLGATVTAALSGLGSELRDYELVRAFAAPSRAHLRLDGSHLQRLPQDLRLWLAVRRQLRPSARRLTEPSRIRREARGAFSMDTAGRL